MQFGDTVDAITSVPIQSHTPRPRLLMITDGLKGHSSYVEDDDDNDFVDTPPKRKKTLSHFHPPTEEHTAQEYYPTKPEGHDIYTSAQPQAGHTNDEPQHQLTMDVILAKSTEKSEVHSVGEALQQEKGSPRSTPTSGLPIKRAPRPTQILQSPYITGAGKQIKHSDDAIIFDKQANETDVVAFQNWFNRGYKPRNKYVHLMLCALIYEVG
ncbi:Hypothetical predicted protein [Olea europaea subsp. europaea]|uniref:Uncharacterized protein n=1 Tax=Olea europaea subsp. europaea TaxID=158383 RepID=A0A8S0RIR1_OLEEU|nr:Hypothetical predicted protein [Olea europaea subsp. europaea]